MSPTEPLLARDLMTREVVTVPPSTPVIALARLLAERGISSVPVTAPDGRLLGIVTEADLLRRLADLGERRPGWLRGLFADRDRQADRYARSHGATAGDVMTAPAITVEEDVTAERIAALMEERRIRRVPVVKDGRLIGIVSRADLLQAVLARPDRLHTEAASGDERIREAVWREIREQPWADTATTFVEVKDGVVRLYGFVRSDAARRGLLAIARRVEGVAGVEDNMEEMVPSLLGY